jgi:hypothetical protein
MKFARRQTAGEGRTGTAGDDVLARREHKGSPQQRKGRAMWKTLGKMMARVSATRPPAGSGRNPRKPRRFRPAVEGLEDRLVPATFLVTTTADVVNPADGLLSLREAISMANATAAADTIMLKAGTYAIGIDIAGEDANAGGDFDVTNPLTIVGRSAAATVVDGAHLDRVFDVIGQFDVQFSNLTIQNGQEGISVAGAGVNALDANITLNHSTVRRNTCSSGAGIWALNGDVTLNHSTVTDNIATGNGGGIWALNGDVTLDRSTVSGNQGANGGGIFAGSGAVTATDSRLTGNTATRPFNGAADGGGLDAEHGNVTLVRVTVDHNHATEKGGGLYAPNGTVTLRDSTVKLNFAGLVAIIGGLNDPPPPFLGGGVFAHDVTAINSTVSRNTAFLSGGGISAVTVNLSHSTVSGNLTPSDGAGVFATTVVAENSTVSGNIALRGAGGGIKADTVTLTGTTVSGNNASRGAGVFAVTATAVNSTVSGNVAFTGSGGGINATTVNLTDSTVSGNIASLGGGVVAQGGTILNSTIVENTATTNAGGVLWTAGVDHIHFKNTIVADNLVLSPLAVGVDVSGNFISDGHNLIGIVNGGTGFGAPGDQLGTADQPLDPLLGPLAFNGGPTQTHALQAGSPAIDHGDNSGAPATDQRGVARPRDGDGNGSRVADIGAVER